MELNGRLRFVSSMSNFTVQLTDRNRFAFKLVKLKYAVAVSGSYKDAIIG